jgi:competence protein ComEC
VSDPRVVRAGGADPVEAQSSADSEGPDLRLAPFVGSLWLGEALVLLARPSRPGYWLAGAAALIVAGLLGSALAVRRRAGVRSPPDPEGPAGAPLSQAPHGVRPSSSGAPHFALLIGVCGLGLGLAVGAAHLARLHPPVLAGIVQQGAALRAEVAVTGDPRAHIPADDGGRPMAPTWSVPARLGGIVVRGHTYSVRVPVLLRGNQVRYLRYGSRVTLTGRAGESWSPEVQSLTLQVLGPVQVRSPPGPVARATTRIRDAFREACAGLPADAGALLLGLAVGDESTLPPDLDAAMVRAGLSHLTAVSGSNTSLVVAIAMAAVAGMGLGWRARVITCLAVLSGYVMLVRPQPSVLRAAVMGVVALVALSTGGRRRGPPALLASALVLLLVLPQFALSLGFALSFSATAGLLVVGPALAERLGRWQVSSWMPEPIRAALAVAAAAHLATLPLAILMGSGASLVALPANVLVTPLVPVATVLGLAAALIAPLASAPATLVATIASPATGAIAWVARVSSALPFGVLDVPAGPVSALGSAAVLALAATAAARGWRPWRDRRVVLALAASLALGMTVRHISDARWPPPGWVVLACDVGQGDGLLIRAQGADEALLVDAGPDVDRITACLRDAGVERLAVLITHFHADHIDGLSAVLGQWPVSVVLTTPVPEPADGATEVVGAARTAGVPIRLVRAGDQVVVAGVALDILWPARPMDQSPANNASVVALAQVPSPRGAIRALLTGDIEPEAQSVLMAQPPPRVQVVKVPHHGSRYQVPQFAQWSGARIALFCVGQDNDYGHPSESTLQQYRDAGARIGRTDDQGDLAVVPVDRGVALIVRR